MEKQKVKEYSSVDLTEDEDSSEGDVGKDGVFPFVDCSKYLDTPTSTPVHDFENPVVTSFSKDFNNTIKPKSLKVKPSSAILQESLGKKVGQFTSIQIKPPKYSGPNTTDISEGSLLNTIRAVAVPSDSETGVANCLQYKPCDESSKTVTPENSATYLPKKPRGKVLTLQKNNKLYKVIIPHNVMPDLNRSIGPVLINIPEVGPLVINNDPRATEIQSLSFNLDAVEHVEQKLNADPVEKVPYLENKALQDKKFCWTAGRKRKLDLEGFTFTDRLGFNKTEVKRARKCEKEVIRVLMNYDKRLSRLSDEYEKFKMSLLKQENVTLVKINSILERGKRKRNRSVKKKIAPCENLESNISGEDEPSHPPEADSTIETDDYGSDLLVTKKVVILDKNNREVRRKHTNEVSIGNIVNGRRKKGPTKGNQPSKSKSFHIKPCYVQITKDNRVEEAYKRLCRDIEAKKQSLGRSKSKERLDGQKFAKLHNTPKHFKPNHANVEESKAAEDKAILLSRIIRSDQFLEKELNVHKPVLIVTEQTIGTDRSLEYYCNEFSRNNIVFVVHPNKGFSDIILKSEGFVSAVEIGYIKLVDVNLFSKFVKNDLKFYDSEDAERYREHNYTLLTHTMRRKYH